MKRCGRVGLAATLLVLFGLPAGAASASVDLDEVAGSLRSNPVYVDADAERALTDDEVDGAAVGYPQRRHADLHCCAAGVGGRSRRW